MTYSCPMLFYELFRKPLPFFQRALASALSIALLGLMCLSISLLPAHGQSSHAQQGTQTSRPTSTPYSGDLSIFETEGRDQRLQIGRVMDLLGIVPGKTAADLGAGSGWFTVRAAKRVGPTGSVYAEDINPAAHDYIEQRLKREGIANVHVVLGTPEDPKLPPGSLDAVLMLKVYHEIANPVVFLRTLLPALKTGAKIGIIDKNGDGTDHGIMPDVIVREMAEAGLKLTATYHFTKADGQDYFLIFQQK